MEFGTALGSTNLRLGNWPANSVPQGAFVSVEEAMRGGRVALRAIAVGEPILADKVSDEGGLAQMDAFLHDRLRAVSSPVNTVLDVAGFVREGEGVEVLWNRQLTGEV